MRSPGWGVPQRRYTQGGTVSIDGLMQHISLRDSVRACRPLVVSVREGLVVVHPAHEQQAVHDSIAQSLPHSMRVSGYLSREGSVVPVRLGLRHHISNAAGYIN
jgi:hypothetical protein